MCQNFITQEQPMETKVHSPGVQDYIARGAQMILNDLRTLRSKIDRMSRSSERVAARLSQHPAVETVNYPGLANFEGHGIAK
jgi:cystathionine beta-lyase/cystathionine gamma-synthase